MKKNLFKKLLSVFLVSALFICSSCNSSVVSINQTEQSVEQTTEQSSSVQQTTETTTINRTIETTTTLNSITTDSNTQLVKEENGTHVVVDHLGHSVEVPNEINRVVVSDIYPLVSVLSIFFDSADKIVGMAMPSMTAAKNSLLSELYPSLLNANTEFINGANINIEELIKLEPDVVIYPSSNASEGEAIAKAGIPAIAVSVNKWNYNAIETLNNWIKLLSEVFLVNDKYDKVKEYSDRVYKDVQDRVSHLSTEEKRNIFFLFQYNDNNIMTSGKNFFGNWWAEAIGGINSAVELEKDNSVSVNMEQIYEWNPDLIFITNFNTAYPSDLYNNTVGSYDWSEIDAVKNKQCFKMPLGMYRTYTPGVDTPVSLYWFAKQAYPELFEDIDIKNEVKTYYNDVFGITLTDEQVEKIFNPEVSAGAGFANGK